MNRLASTLVLLGVSASVGAEPIEYTFVLENVEQSYSEYPDPPPPIGEPIELIELPLETPLYAEAPSVSGSFTYNPDAAGFLFGAPVGAEPSSGSVSYPVGTIDNVVFTINGEEFVRGSKIVAFVDETAGPPQPDSVVPVDAIISFGFTPTVVSIPYDGRVFDEMRSSFFFAEGENTGFNFFPDAVLSEPYVQGPSPVALPSTLPPKGAELRRFSITLEEDDAAVPRRQYRISGELILNPAPPEPPPVPRDYVYTIEIIGQYLLEAGNQIPLANPIFDNASEINGGFSYNPTLPYPNAASLFLCDDPANCIAGATSTGEIANLSVSALGQDFRGKSNNLMQLLNDTEPTPPQLELPDTPLLAGAQDLFFIGTLPFGEATSTIQFEHEGVTYESTGLYLEMWEGETGNDFFPEPPAAQGFPAELPPTGSDLQLAVLSFSSTEEVSPGVSRAYRVLGYLSIKDAPIDVAIDVDPFSLNNTVLPNSDDPIVVSIASSSTVNGEAVDFDTSKIDPATLRFGSGKAPNIAFPMPFDFTGDNNTDVAVVFKTQDAGILCNDTEVELTGATYSGQLFRGTDTIDASECTDGSCHPL